MPTPTMARSAEEVVADWRRGLAEDGWEHPAGPLFISAHAEHDLTARPMRTTQTSFITCLTPGLCCF